MASSREKLLAANKKAKAVAGNYDKEPTRNDQLVSAPPVSELKEESQKPVENKVEKAPAKSEKKETVAKQKVKPVVETNVNKSKPTQTITMSEDVKKKRINYGLPTDVIKYLKFKAARTSTPQYKLVSSLFQEKINEIEAGSITYKDEILETYRVRLINPSAYATDVPEDLYFKIKETAGKLAMTPTQFYNYVLTEAKKQDTDFEF